MQDNEADKLEIEFYRTRAGNEPVRDWLKQELSRDDRRVIGEDIFTVQLGFPIGMPLVRPFGENLYEIRSHLPQHRISRIVFCVIEGTMILLHGFIKKTQRTPDEDVRLARKRQREVGGAGR